MYGEIVVLCRLSTVVAYHTAVLGQQTSRNESQYSFNVSTFDFSRLHSKHTSVARFLALPMVNC
jgi:hypothetical protein